MECPISCQDCPIEEKCPETSERCPVLLDRVDPEYVKQFEQYANQVCHLSKYDYYEYPVRFSQTVHRIQNVFRQLAKDKGKKRAAELAIEEYGDAFEVAKLNRGGFVGFVDRLLYFRRYSFHRLAYCFVSSSFHCWSNANTTMHVTVSSFGGYNFRYIGYGSDYLIGILAPIAILFFNALPVSRFAKKLLGFGITVWVVNILMTSFGDSRKELLLCLTTESLFIIVFLIILNLIDVIGVGILLVLLSAEILELPGKREAKLRDEGGLQMTS